MFNQFPSLAEAFLNYFDIDLVATQAERDRVGRLRYRVYCEEFGYEPAEKFPDGRETDRFDDHSLHCIITHRRSGETAGCVRLICATDKHLLPLEAYCLPHVFRRLPRPAGRRAQPGVRGVPARGRPGLSPAPGRDTHPPGGVRRPGLREQERRTFSLISIAAVLAGFAMSSLTDRTRIFTMMEANLPRLLRRAGIMMELAGDAMEYHGQRSAYFVTTDSALNTMRNDLHVMYDAIYGRLAYSTDARANVA